MESKKSFHFYNELSCRNSKKLNSEQKYYNLQISCLVYFCFRIRFLNREKFLELVSNSGLLILYSVKK